MLYGHAHENELMNVGSSAYNDHAASKEGGTRIIEETTEKG